MVDFSFIMMSDAEILQKLRDGDEEVTRQYFYGWCRMAFKVCDERYGLWNKENMDFYSLSHDFYLRLALDGWRSPQRRNEGMKLSTWMVNGFRYIVLDRLKSDTRHVASASISDIDVADDGLSEEIRKLLNDLIYGVYEGDTISQTILQSIFVEGYTGKETAERLGITPSAVSQRFSIMMRETVKPFFLEHLKSGGMLYCPSGSITEKDYSGYAGSDANYSAIPSEFNENEIGENMFGKLFKRKKLSEEFSAEDRVPDVTEIIPAERISPEVITTLGENEIFVFGSNLQGMHGGGAARIAYKSFGAEWGVGVGMTGRTYAIPTMQGGVETIEPYVDEFIAFAKTHPELRFLVTRIGCGIAGFDESDIAPLFAAAKDVENIALPESFWKYV